MQDKGINSTFKKIIYESSEMVFLADDTYPYSIFYGNESFEETIGQSLTDRSLVGLGLDINAYIFKEELVLNHTTKEFSFKLELPQDSGSNYFLFYKGKEIKSIGLPSKKEAYQFFNSSLELIGMGQSDQLTYLNPIVLPLLGYAPEELLLSNICPIIHEEDLPSVKQKWKLHKGEQTVFEETVRIKSKSGKFKYLKTRVSFQGETFSLIALDVTRETGLQKAEHKLGQLKQDLNPKDRNSWFKLSKKQTISFEYPAAKIFDFNEESIGQNEFEGWLVNQISQKSSSIDSIQKFTISHPEFGAYSCQAFEVEEENEIWGIITSKQEDLVLKSELNLQKEIWNQSPEALLVVRLSGEVISSNLASAQLFQIENGQETQHLDELSSFFGDNLFWKEWVFKAKESVQRYSIATPTEPSENHMVLEVSTRRFMVADEEVFVSLSFKNNSEKAILEQTIEESNQFLVNLTEQVPGGLYQLVLNSEGQMNFSFLSKGIHSVLGVSKDKVNQLTDLSMAISKVHPLDLPQVIMTSVASAKKMEPWQCQFRVKAEGKPDEYRWVLGAARPQAMENGDMVWYGYLTDITKQKEFENSLNEAKTAAEKANQIKSDFLSMISHELRTPLNAISGSVYSLIQENPTEGQKSALNTINFAVDNLIIMINDLLDFQKIEAGKLTIEQAPFNLNELLQQVIMGLSFHAKDSQNKLSLHASKDLNLSVRGDKTRISQVLNNLITNALKFTKDGSVDVKVELLSRELDKIRVYFEVKDTGIGIAPEHQDRIFNDFDQVKPTFSTKYGGTGLGLSITRKLLQLMGGKIALESEVGKGSRFFFELEFDLAQESANSKSTTDSKDSVPAGLHMLMAEDNDVNALVLGKIIKKWGYTFKRVNNGREAVDAAREATYDCILMDIQMPEMDGFEATLAIKAFSQTPIIALTAAAKLEIMERIDECGFDGFVAKPIDAAELHKKIKEVVSEHSHKS